MFILIQDALRSGDAASPPGSMRNTLDYSAAVAIVAAPLPVCVGLFGMDVRRRRLNVDRGVGRGWGPDLSSSVAASAGSDGGCQGGQLVHGVVDAGGAGSSKSY